MPTRIEDSQQLTRFATQLQRLGYGSVEQFLGTAAAAPEALARYLNIGGAELQAVVGSIPTPAKALAQGAARPKFRLGVRLDRIRPPAVSLMRAPGLVVSLPPTINMIAQMQPIRDQGQRGTCVAHASCAVAEHFWRASQQVIDLSRQFLYWDCKEHDGDPDAEGTWVAVAMARLQADGCCLEATWPYVMNDIPGNESQDPPPAGAVAAALAYKIPAFQQIAPTSVTDIKAALAQGRCVAFSIPVFNSWYQNDEVTRTGEIINPLQGEPNVGGHAMCFVGYEDVRDNGVLGGGKFYLRNSWGAQWATQSVLGTPGYGTIPYSYIGANCSEAYSIG